MNVLDIALEKLEKAKRYNHYVASLCPIHKDTKPSFFVYADYYICLACGAQGSSKKLLGMLTTLPERIPTSYGQSKSRNPFTKWEYSQSLPKTIEIARRNLSFRTSHYLESRGIDRNKQLSLGLGLLDGFIVFPIYNHWNEPIGAVARAGENTNQDVKYYVPKGQDPNLLYVPSWKKIHDSNQVFVTFGIIDSIALHLLGHASASTTTGQTINPKAFDKIRKTITIVPDRHEEISAIKAASRLSWRGDTAIINYPVGTKDPADLFIKDRNLLHDSILARSL